MAETTIEWTHQKFLEYLTTFLGAFPEDLDQAADLFNEFAEIAQSLLDGREWREFPS
jgi:hypothetical protein